MVEHVRRTTAKVLSVAVCWALCGALCEALCWAVCFALSCAIPPASAQQGCDSVPPASAQPGRDSVPPASAQPGRDSVPPASAQPGRDSVPPASAQPASSSTTPEASQQSGKSGPPARAQSYEFKTMQEAIAALLARESTHEWQKIDWRTDAAKALSDAQEQSKPIFVFFTVKQQTPAPKAWVGDDPSMGKT